MCSWDMDAVTDVDQDACSFKNLKIDVLNGYVGIHVLANVVLGKDNWDSGSLRKHVAWDFGKGVVRGKGQREKRRTRKNKAKSGTEREGTYRSHDCVRFYTSRSESFRDKSQVSINFDTCLLITILLPSDNCLLSTHFCE